MKLIFEKDKQNNKGIIVSFDKQHLIFNLNDVNSINNDSIISMLTSIAREISANNFDYKNEIVKIEEKELGELKDLYNFVFNLFNTFIQKFIEESKNYKKELDETNQRIQNKINETL